VVGYVDVGHGSEGSAVFTESAIRLVTTVHAGNTEGKADDPGRAASTRTSTDLVADADPSPSPTLAESKHGAPVGSKHFRSTTGVQLHSVLPSPLAS